MDAPKFVKYGDVKQITGLTRFTVEFTDSSEDPFAFTQMPNVETVMVTSSEEAIEKFKAVVVENHSSAKITVDACYEDNLVCRDDAEVIF